MRKLVLLFALFLSLAANAQEKVIVHINAEFNKSNDWYGLSSVTGVRVFGGYIDKNQAIKEKYNVTRVPTLILFVDGKEIKRWEGQLDMKIHEKVSEVQAEIDSL